MISQSIRLKRQKPRHVSLMVKTGSSPFDWECYQGELSELKEKGKQDIQIGMMN